MSHDHGHGQSAVRAGERHRGRLRLSLALIVGFLVVQVVVGLVAGSLAVLSDAGHMLTDAVGLGMALAAITVASRAASSGTRTFGLYRLEILAALVNAVLLFGVAGYVFLEAARRFGDPPDVPGFPVLAVGVVGLALNIVVMALLRAGSRESLNLEGAYLEVLADALGSLGVILAAVVLMTTGWPYVDPLVGAGIGLFILPRAWRLGREALRILLQAAPSGLDLGSLQGDLAALPDVVDVHDLHVWTLTSEMEVASARVMVRAGADSHAVLDRARELLRDRYGLSHATFQVEPDDHDGCEEVAW
ncbi:MAG: cation diffusion facilitator family transporter [Acidimicrobiia bacterium]